MCGIAGYVVRAGEAGAWPGQLQPALKAIEHRGPDDHGMWFTEDGRVGLGHRRLSIVDLSPTGHQPMVSHCGKWMMVFNGEVYNFQQIRPELERLGHRFRGSSDSEVILAAVSEWGMQALQRFVGMFAIALWSIEERALYLVRDRLGVKPLYYGLNEGALWFGSELKALRAFSGWAPEIDRDALVDYFRYGYIGGARSIYRGVAKLLPGHWLRLRQGAAPEVVRYWSVLENAQDHRGRSEEALTDQLEELLTDAFGLRMIADVPVGVFLSGGVDSSVLAAVLQRRAGRSIKTFTIGFDEAEKNEAPFAEAVARHLGTEHHAEILRPEQAMAMLPQWGHLYDEPFGDSSGIPTLLVSQVAARDVKVVLSADGGDELFCGYGVYTNVPRQWDRVHGMPGWLRGAGRAALSALPLDTVDDALAALGPPDGPWQRLRGAATIPARKIRDRLGCQSLGAVYDQALGASNWPDAELARLLGAAPATRARADSYPGTGPEPLCLWDMHNYMVDDVLVKVDRATMRTSIEGRDPLIDHRIAEFAFGLPLAMRQGALGSKHLLRKVLYRHVPRELVDRPKQGFGLPMGQWMRGPLAPVVDKYLHPDRMQGQSLLDPATVRAMRQRLAAGDPQAVVRAWLLVAFEMWREQWMP